MTRRWRGERDNRLKLPGYNERRRLFTIRQRTDLPRMFTVFAIASRFIYLDCFLDSRIETRLDEIILNLHSRERNFDVSYEKYIFTITLRTWTKSN